MNDTDFVAAYFRTQREVAAKVPDWTASDVIVMLAIDTGVDFATVTRRVRRLYNDGLMGL